MTDSGDFLLGPESLPKADDAAAFRESYLDAMLEFLNLHARLLDHLQDELLRAGHDRMAAEDALLVFRIGRPHIPPGIWRARPSVRPLRLRDPWARLEAAGYVRSEIDGRAVTHSLTDEGRDLAALVERLMARSIDSLGRIAGIDAARLEQFRDTMSRFDGYWSEAILYGL